MSKRVPEGWSKNRLGKLFSLNTKSVIPNDFPNEQFAYFSLPAYDQFGKSIEVFGEDIESNKFNIETDTILVSKLNPRKPRVILARPQNLRVCASTEFMSYVPIEKDQVSLDYFTHFFFSNLFQKKLQLVATGSTNSHVRATPSETINWDITVPPLPEQKKIASILTAVDEVIENSQKQIDKLQDLKKATMNELLTKGIGHTKFKDSPVGRIPVEWEVFNVSDILDFKNGLNKEKDAFGSGVPIVNYMDVYKNELILADNLEGKVNLTQSEIKRFSVKGGDVFFTRTSETPEEIGLSGAYFGGNENTVFSGFILRGRPLGKNLNTHFSGYFFRENYIRTQIIKGCSYTTRALTNGTLLGQVIIALPNLFEQEKIASILSNMDSQIEKLSKKLHQIQSLKKALMQDLLTGKVRVIA